MNTIKYSILFFLMTTHLSSFGQWVEQNSNTSYDLNKVQFVSEDIGFIVGDFGTILKTENGGKLWYSLDIETIEKIASIQFIDENIGFVGTMQGSVFKTNNGGIIWSQIDIDIETNIELYFINPMIGFIGTKNQIHKTTDGGENWIETDVSMVDNIKTVYEIECNGNNCYALIKEGILKSTNQGDNWQQIIDENHPDYNPANFLESIEIIDDELIFIGSPYYQGLYKTENDFENLSFSPIIIDDIEFLNHDIGYSIQESGRTITKTIDGAENWTTQFTIQDNESRVNDLYFIDADFGWAIGNNGKILKTNNGGILTSIKELQAEQNLVIYPNPTNGILKIFPNKSNTLLSSEIQVFTIAGEHITTLTLDTDSKTINLGFLNFGSYILKYKKENRLYSSIIVKE